MMEKEDNNQIDDLLSRYFSGALSESESQKVDQWRKESIENEKIYNEVSKTWESLAVLGQMKQFNAKEALVKINQKISKTRLSVLGEYFRKVAVILLLPVLIYAGYVTFNGNNGPNPINDKVAWHEVKTSTGMISEIVLPDGTHVWLNSETRLLYPIQFGDIREVKLSGEAYFDVKKDALHPFVINTEKMNVEVLGTSFNVTNYPSENQTEVMLKTGKVSLFTGDYKHKKEIGSLLPDQRATFNNLSSELSVSTMNVEKYASWKDGILVFDNDPMIEVIRKLGRWYNVDFVLENDDLKEYVYKATFKDESLLQVLDLLKISAPIEYTILQREKLPDGSYTRKKVLIQKKNI